jgi:hypothetical protein
MKTSPITVNKWFAWRPVFTVDSGVTWLRTINRVHYFVKEPRDWDSVKITTLYRDEQAVMVLKLSQMGSEQYDDEND